ncbi:hypothetical protein LP419_39240 [Massilia sp. H-1]|nr:hypothetical protein LP419_39240 [Massilia sp. H-1]
MAVNTSGPTARIFNPVRDTLVGAVVDIRGIATAPLDFKEYRIYLGNGENPSAWRLLRRSCYTGSLAGTLASWDTFGVSENTPYSIKLEAEDLYGEIATETVTVTVDNTPPLAPVQLSANADGANVTLHWTASTSPDVAWLHRAARRAHRQRPGRRDRQLETVPGDRHHPPRPERGRWPAPLCGNGDGQGGKYEPAVERGQRHARHPCAACRHAAAAGERAYRPQHLSAGHLAGHRRRVGPVPVPGHAAPRSGTDVGASAVALPYAATLDGTAFVPGDYLLRAVATDIHGKTDPAPTAITVTFSETPDVITDLKAKVNGGTVTLTWSSPATGLTGYLLERYDGQGVVTRIAVLSPGQRQLSGRRTGGRPLPLPRLGAGRIGQEQSGQ